MSRHGRSRASSIPIPRSTSSTSPSRNIESVISIPLSPGGTRRPRLSGVANLSGEQRASGASQGVRGSSSLITSPPARLSARSLTLMSTMRPAGSPRSPNTFEPRVIRADSSRNNDNACLPSSSASPTRTRRSSAAGLRPPSAQRRSPGRGLAPPPASPVSFPRPAYLEHSSLRDFLQTESLPSIPSRKSTESSNVGEVYSFIGRAHNSMSPPTDSDDDSNVSPPRDVAPLPLPSTVPSSDIILRLPTRWSDQVRHPSLSVSSDGRELTYHGPSSNGDKEAAAARTVYPIPPACGIFYYEVEVLSKGQKGHISIGFAGRDVKLSRLPGWEKTSWGYHGDDGSSFAAEREGTPYGPKFGTGDVIGCGVDFSQSKAFYTKNGSFLGMVFDNVGKDCEIYPSVGLRHPGEAIRVNFGHDLFKYDIEYHVQQQRNQTWAKILSTSLKSSSIVGGDQMDTLGKAATEEQLRVPINHLVLSYLTHHGYARTARSFQVHCEKRGTTAGEAGLPPGAAPVGTKSRSAHVVMVGAASDDQDMDIDGVATAKEPVEEGDIELRTRIVNSVVAGDIDTALTETEKHHPTVFEEGLMFFKLRCRKFVELILEAAELRRKMKMEELEMAVEEEDESAVENGVIGFGAGDMDIDDDISLAPTTNGMGGSSAAIPIRSKRKPSASSLGWWTAATATQYEMALNTAITYGQTLQTDYKADSRPEVQAIFKRTFGIVAYVDPMEAGADVAEIVGQEARVKLANEMNQAILKSQGRPTHPALERLYRQTAACITQLGLLGVGAAAFADMPKEFLDA